jgi:hypothetical protein
MAALFPHAFHNDVYLAHLASFFPNPKYIAHEYMFLEAVRQALR